MLTWLTMLIQKIEGSNLVLIIVSVMWLLYLGFFFVVKANRGKEKREEGRTTLFLLNPGLCIQSYRRT